MRMYNPPHPGVLLQDLWLEPLNLSITQTAKHLGVSRKTISEIVNGKAGISSDMAVRLEMAFGKSAKSWLAHQASYDLWHIEQSHKIVGIQAVFNPAVVVA